MQHAQMMYISRKGACDRVCKGAYDISAADMLSPSLYLLQEASSVKGGEDGTAAVATLSSAIEQATPFSALEDEVEAAVGLRERWVRRAEAVGQLDQAMQEVRIQTLGGGESAQATTSSM